MTIDTTVNISVVKKRDLHRAANVSGMHCSELVVLLMKKLMRRHGEMAGNIRRIRYQKKTVGIEWTDQHISPSVRDYEYFQDMRRFYKMSVSLLLAVAIDNFMDEYLENVLKGEAKEDETDNYLFKSHILLKNEYDGVVCWKIFWDLHANPDLLYP